MNKKDREKVRLKYDNHCAYCGQTLGKVFHVDHLEPVLREEGHWEVLEDGERHYIPSINGMRYPERDSFVNMMPACPSCNIMKNSHSLEQFRGLIQGFIRSLNRDSTQYKIAKRYKLILENQRPVIFHFEKFL